MKNLPKFGNCSKSLLSNKSINAEYFIEYCKKLGFGNYADVKNFFGAKDIASMVDLNYIKLLNKQQV
ncbi:MAG: hypothetical protein V1649_00905 [Patescibacteria group bacterium]